MNHIYIYVGNWVKLSGCLDLDLVWFKFSTTSLVNQCMLGMFLNTWTSWGPCERAGGVYVQVSGKPLYSQIEPKATVAVGAEYLRNLSLSCVEASHALPRAMTIIAFSRDHQGKDFSNCYKDVIIPCYFQIHVFALYKKRGQAVSLSLFLSRLFIALCCFSSLILSQTSLECFYSLRPLWKLS